MKRFAKRIIAAAGGFMLLLALAACGLGAGRAPAALTVALDEGEAARIELQWDARLYSFSSEDAPALAEKIIGLINGRYADSTFLSPSSRLYNDHIAIYAPDGSELAFFRIERSEGSETYPYRLWNDEHKNSRGYIKEDGRDDIKEIVETVTIEREGEPLFAPPAVSY